MMRRCWLRSFSGFVAAIGAALVNAPKVTAEEGRFHLSHNCPRCGRTVFRVHSWRRDGRHYHACGRTLWYH